jgi:hypothetical protein
VTAVWVAVLAVLVALAYTGMWKGWRNRAARQSDLPEPRWLELGGFAAEYGTVDGTYVSTTTAGNWLDRVTAHELGTISDVTLAAEVGQSLLVIRPGARSFKIGAADLIGVRRERGIAGKVREKDGLVVITWRLGSAELDTGIRPDHRADGERIEELVSGLMEGADHG